LRIEQGGTCVCSQGHISGQSHRFLARLHTQSAGSRQPATSWRVQNVVCQ
jgi:hypothetical protein